MGLFSRLFGEFVDVIEWTDDSSDTMVYRFERYGNEIKYGAKLIVRESQVAVFVNEGEVADVLGPGTYELETRNLPVLTAIQHWDHGFKSPFKAEVYFCNTKRFTDLKWGTRQPLMIRDSEFGGLRIRAFGTYTVRVENALTFIREITGTDGVFTTDEISDQLRNLITSRFASIIAGAGIPVLDMAANYDQLGQFLTTRIAPEFNEYGLELTRVLVENISLPQTVSDALDKRTSMGMVGNLDQYLQYQSGVAMETAAANPGGEGASGIGMGVGMAMANRMAEQMTPATPAPPPLPAATLYHIVEGDHAIGPFPMEEIRRRITTGLIDGDTLVWAAGMAEWVPARAVPAINRHFNLVDSEVNPPPVPNS